MKFCSHCGKEVHEEAVVCINCGCAIAPTVPMTPQNARPSVATDPNDASSTGFAILGFLIPLIGLVLYFLNHNETPQKAKSALHGAIAGWITEIVISIICSIIVLTI